MWRKIKAYWHAQVTLHRALRSYQEPPSTPLSRLWNLRELRDRLNEQINQMEREIVE